MDDRILVPFDGSDPATTALDRALDEHPNAAITVLHVLDLDELAYGGGGGGGIEEAKREEAEERFEEAQDRADAYDVTLETTIETGQPGDAIVEYAEQNDIDNIVMGSHGRSGLSGILVGSVAETVIQNSPVTVTIAR